MRHPVRPGGRTLAKHRETAAQFKRQFGEMPSWNGEPAPIVAPREGMKIMASIIVTGLTPTYKVPGVFMGRGLARASFQWISAAQNTRHWPGKVNGTITLGRTPQLALSG